MSGIRINELNDLNNFISNILELESCDPGHFTVLNEGTEIWCDGEPLGRLYYDADTNLTIEGL